MPHDRAKSAAGLKALEFLTEGMVIGLGTGSTSQFFIKHLIQKCRNGFQIKAVATSIASETLAKEGGIPIVDIQSVDTLDLTVDGADEIDPEKRLIKGAGGALMREKIIASMSKEMIVIADETKLVKKLGKAPLPIEVIPFAIKATEKHLSNLGYTGKWRTEPDTSPFVTDNHNWIFDLTLPSNIDPAEEHRKITQIPGVVDTGFFLNLATRILIGQDDGSVVVQT